VLGVFGRHCRMDSSSLTLSLQIDLPADSVLEDPKSPFEGLLVPKLFFAQEKFGFCETINTHYG